MSLLKKIWKNNSKHKKLCEDWSNQPLGSQLSLTPEAEPTERRFRLKYVGAVPAERACSAPATAAAIAQAVTQSKTVGRKLRRVEVTVSSKGIAVEDAITSERLLDVSIYKISYCSADAAHGQVFAFIAAGPSDNLECHAFLCPKRKMARAATLAAAQSFNTAYQQWQTNQEKRPKISGKEVVAFQQRKDDILDSCSPPKAMLIDLYTGESPTNSPWVSFDEDVSTELWDTPATQILTSNPLFT